MDDYEEDYCEGCIYRKGSKCTSKLVCIANSEYQPKEEEYYTEE